jgi:hypothetical protein
MIGTDVDVVAGAVIEEVGREPGDSSVDVDVSSSGVRVAIIPPTPESDAFTDNTSVANSVGASAVAVDVSEADSVAGSDASDVAIAASGKFVTVVVTVVTAVTADGAISESVAEDISIVGYESNRGSSVVVGMESESAVLVCGLVAATVVDGLSTCCRFSCIVTHLSCRLFTCVLSSCPTA